MSCRSVILRLWIFASASTGVALAMNSSDGAAWRTRCQRHTILAKEQFNLPKLQAFAALAQKALCKSEDIRTWSCPQCQKVGFSVAAETARIVRRDQLGEADATAIYVARLSWLPNQTEYIYRPLLRTLVQHLGEACLPQCGRSGWCKWCGIGHACCHPTNSTANPAECSGAVFKSQIGHHLQCAQSSATTTPAPLSSRGEDCFDRCGMASGFCTACGSGNACCRRGQVDAPPECQGEYNHTVGYSGYECVRPALAAVQRAAEDVQVDDRAAFGCVVSFRGTKNVANAVKDATFIPQSLSYEQCRGCKVHRGFFDVWEAVEAKVVRSLAELGCAPGTSRSSLLITGHSMGAALATLAMFTMEARGYSVAQAYNFAGPRMGNAAFSRAFDNWFSSHPPLFRVTHANDVVSQMSPRWLFRHVGSEVFFPGDDPKKYVLCGCEESLRCQAGQPFWKMLTRHWSLSVHCLMPLGGGIGNICQCAGKLV